MLDIVIHPKILIIMQYSLKDRKTGYYREIFGLLSTQEIDFESSVGQISKKYFAGVI